MKKNYICWTDDIKQHNYYFLNCDNKIESSKFHQISISINSAYAIFNNQLLAWTPKTENLFDESFDFLQTNPVKFDNFGTRRVSKIFCNHQICHIITEEGLVYSWGTDRDKTGILALGENYNQLTPVFNYNFKDMRIKMLSISEKHACAIDNRHQLYSWGTGLFGELGLKSITRTNVPFQVNIGNILAMSIQCGMNYTIILNYENIPFYFGIIDFIINANRNDIDKNNGNDVNSSIEQLTHYDNYDYTTTSQHNIRHQQPIFDENIKTIPFDSPYKINIIFCGEAMIALVDLMGNLFVYSDREGLNRIRIAMSIHSVKFVNSRIYALTKQCDYLYEFASIRGDYNSLEDYIENMYSINTNYNKISLIDTPYYDKALFFSVECTNVAKAKAENKQEKVFNLIKNHNMIKEENKGGHIRYNSALTTNNYDSTRLNIQFNDQSHNNIHYHSGNISPHPSSLTSHTVLSRQTKGSSSTTKQLHSCTTRLSMPNLKVKSNLNGKSRIGKISDLLGHIFDTKIDQILQTNYSTSNSNYLLKGKKRIELERIYPGYGYCNTREGLYTTENCRQLSQKRSMSLNFSSREEINDSCSKKKYNRTSSQDRYINSQEVNQILKRAKRDDDFIESIRNEKEYERNIDGKNMLCRYEQYTEREEEKETFYTLLDKDNKQKRSKEREEIKESIGINVNKDDNQIREIVSTVRKKGNTITNCESMREQNKKDRQNQMKIEGLHIKKTKDISKFLTKHKSKINNDILESKIEEEDNNTQSQVKSILLSKSKDSFQQNIKEQDEIISNKKRCQASLHSKITKTKLVSIKRDMSNQQLVFVNHNKYMRLKEITDSYINYTKKQPFKEEEAKNKLTKSKSFSLIQNKSLNNQSKTQLAPKELFPITIYQKPIKQPNKMAMQTIIDKEEVSKGISILNNNQLIASNPFITSHENLINYSKTTPLSMNEVNNKKDDSELNEALFSFDDALNNLSTKRQSLNELSSNNMNKRTNSDISSKIGINTQGLNNLHIEHIDLYDIVNKPLNKETCNYENNNNKNLIKDDENNINTTINAKRTLINNRNTKASFSSPSITITSTTQIASSIYQHLLTKSKPNEIKEINGENSNPTTKLLNGVKAISIDKNNRHVKKSSSMASIRPIHDSKKKTSLTKDVSQRNAIVNRFNSFNRENNNTNCNDIFNKEKDTLLMNKHQYSTNINSPIKLINIQQGKGENNINLHSITLTKINKKSIKTRPSFASSNPRIIAKVKNGEISHNQSKTILSKTIKGINNNTIIANNTTNTFETKESSPLKRQKSLGNISPHYNNTMIQNGNNINKTKHSLLLHRNYSHSNLNKNNTKIIIKPTLKEKNIITIKALREKYIKYLEKIYNNDQNKIINQLLSPKRSDNNLIKDFFNKEINENDICFINPTETQITYQDFHNDMRDYIIKHLSNFKLVQVKEQIENNNNNNDEGNQYIPEITKTNNLITLEYDDKKSNASYYEPLELEKSIRLNTIRHSFDKSKIILTTESMLDKPNNSNNNVIKFNSSQNTIEIVDILNNRLFNK